MREPASGLIHLAAALGAVAGLAVLLRAASRPEQAVALGVFGISLIALYGASSLYHLLPLSAAGTARLRRLDHVCIFVLIAGTCTPFCLLALDGAWRLVSLTVVWALALCGVALKVLWMGGPRWLSVALYLGLGWLAVLAVPSLLQSVPAGGMGWVLAGGLVYSAGAVVYALKWPDPLPGVFGFHEVWHLFVVAGSACHFWSVWRYLVPLA